MMMMKEKIVPKLTEWTSLVSLLLEGVSATLDQLGFALLGMIMAFIGLFLSVVDLILKAQQKRLIWVVGSSLLPCFRRNSSSKGKRFDSLVAYFGVACAAWQCLYSTTGYVYAHQNLGNPIRMCLLPFVFVSCVGITQFNRSTVPSDKKSQATEAQTAEEAETEVVRQNTPQLQHSFHFPPDRKRFNKKPQAVISVGEESSNNAFKIAVEEQTAIRLATEAQTAEEARVPGSGTQVRSCRVDGCTANLSKCREYHRRHKVCELHSKTSKVFITGQEQRFCQQCSRFHPLVEFDEGKRSCRKRLDWHNQRRRKPQLFLLSSQSAETREIDSDFRRGDSRKMHYSPDFGVFPASCPSCSSRAGQLQKMESAEKEN